MLTIPQFMSEKKVLRTFHDYNLIVFLSIAIEYSVPLSIGVFKREHEGKLAVLKALETYYGWCDFTDNGMVSLITVDCVREITFHLSEIKYIYLGECENLLTDDRWRNGAIDTEYDFGMHFGRNGELCTNHYRCIQDALLEPVTKLINYIQQQGASSKTPQQKMASNMIISILER